MSRQFYCTKLKLGELQQPSSRRCNNISPKPQPTTNPSISNNNNNDDFESLDYSTGSDKFILTPTERQRIIEEERTRLESFVSTARQHKFSDHHHDQNNININDINQQNYYSMKSDNDNFLDLLSFDELSQTNAKQQFNNLSSSIEQNSIITSEKNLLG
ncbi:unnamed protein product [Schistosoma curassoni]|uniref:Uncharacterized protein n=1 Tax=Schistosoma curassoni TaxID=6186 RepID=A0A183KPM3_9TREM|nr:unnamed protein product [Schistosoma curassoni]